VRGKYARYYDEPWWRGVLGTEVDETVGVGIEKAVGAVSQELGGEKYYADFQESFFGTLSFR
jgi:hypothetical protein